MLYQSKMQFLKIRLSWKSEITLMTVSSFFMLEKLEIIGLLMENAYFQPSTYLIATRLKICKHLKCEVGVEELLSRFLFSAFFSIFLLL